MTKHLPPYIPPTVESTHKPLGFIHSESRNRERPWAVTALSILMIVQAFLLVNLGSFKIYQTITLNRSALAQHLTNIPLAEDVTLSLLLTALNDILIGLSSVSTAGWVSLPSALLAILSAIGLFRLWPIAWINAMFVQGIVLTILLTYHLGGGISGQADYLIMAYSVFIVLYLNYEPVHITFHVPYLTDKELE